MKGVLKSLVGLVLALGWWTIRAEPDDPNHESASRIPAMVWEGGGASLAIEADTTSAAQMRVSFSQAGEEGEERSLQTWEDVSPGHYSWTIDVPSGVGGTVELSAVDPKPGDQLRWVLAVNGDTVDEQADLLEKPLQKGYGFFLQ